MAPRKQKETDKDLIPFQFGLTGKLLTSVNPTRIVQEGDRGETEVMDNFKSLKNLRPTDNGIRGIQGMSKINSTALSTQLKSRNIHQFVKSQPSESHVLVQAFDTNEDNSKVWRNSTSIPNTGDFNGTELHTDSRTTGSITAFAINGIRTQVTSANHGRLNGESVVITSTTSYDGVSIVQDVTTNTFVINKTFVADDATGTWATHTKGRLESGQLGRLLYCNGAETMAWGGDEASLSSFEIFDEFADSFTYDYTEKIKNTLTDASNVASLFRDGDTPIKVSIRISNILPIEGFKFHISTANTNVLDDAMSVFYWDGSAWAAVVNLVDGTITGSSPNEVSFGQTGEITFDSTESVAKQSIIDGRVGFFFKIEIIGADAATRISNVTVKEPFQPLQDFWDGNIRTASSVQLFQDSINKDNTTNVFEDEFTFDEETGGDLSTYMKMDDLTSSEFLQIGFTERQQGLQIKMVPDNSNTSTSATGTIGINDALAVLGKGDTLSVLTVNSVSIITGTITAPASNLTQFNRLIADSINDKVSSPEYTATVDDQIVIIKAKTRGTGVNGFVVATTSTEALTKTNMANARDISSTLTVKYWNGTAWITVGTIIDGTSEDGASFAKSGFITWNPIAENTEFKREVSNEEPFYYYRLEWNSAFSPLNVLCYFIGGVPVQTQIDKYDFALNAQERMWLMSNNAGQRNSARVSTVGTLSAFNGEDSHTFTFGDETPITAAIELFTELTTGAISDVLVAKNNAFFRVTGNSPEDWVVTQVSSDVGCPAPHTFKSSPIGLEFSPLQVKQVAIWQSENGIMMYDSRSIFPISDSISNYFDQSKSESINLDKISDSYSFWTNSNGAYEYHWLFASGSSTSINKELVFDLRRQKWWEADRGSGNRLQCGINVVATNGAHYNYAMIDTGFLERLENGTTWTGDGSAIAYEFEFGDVAFGGNTNIETLLRYIRLVMATKSTSSSVTVTHYDDASQTGKTTTLSPSKTGFDATMPVHGFAGSKIGASVFHRLKFTISTDDETIGFEPLWVGGFYEDYRLRLKD